mmetsp:Transcript_27076/g.88849  ORF Transcript_27076/g.88849 Transcript_27076/m.88849 type:complete len:218 (-) Transcript_27076:818-1471(-)
MGVTAMRTLLGAALCGATRCVRSFGSTTNSEGYLRRKSRTEESPYVALHSSHVFGSRRGSRREMRASGVKASVGATGRMRLQSFTMSSSSTPVVVGRLAPPADAGGCVGSCCCCCGCGCCCGGGCCGSGGCCCGGSGWWNCCGCCCCCSGSCCCAKPNICEAAAPAGVDWSCWNGCGGGGVVWAAAMCVQSAAGGSCWWYGAYAGAVACDAPCICCS